MEKEQFRAKVKEMAVDVQNSIIYDSLRLFNSGGIDSLSYEDNYLLPKIILSVVLHNLSAQYAPINPKGKRDAANLKHF